jgi:hypothetical protein
MIPPDDLAQLLEQRRDALEALPGVIGTAVGAGGEGGDEPAIHLYVTPRSDAAHVRDAAGRLLEGAPVEVIEMEQPQAQTD